MRRPLLTMWSSIHLLVVCLALGVELVRASNNESQASDNSSCALPKARILLLNDTFNEELDSVSMELIYRGYEVVWRTELTQSDLVQESRLVIIHKRYLQSYELVVVPPRTIIIDTDPLLDQDLPALTVPSPLDSYGTPELHYKERTITRLFNGINRLRFHSSTFGKRRRLAKPILTISCSSFVLESPRPLPPWLSVVGTIPNWRKLKRVKITTADSTPKVKRQVILHLAGPIDLGVVQRALKSMNLTASQLVVATSTSNDIIDPSGKLRDHFLDIPNVQSYYGLHDVRWLEYADLSSFPHSRFVITSGELLSVFQILALGLIPIVIGHDYPSREVAHLLKRRGLGLDVFENTYSSFFEHKLNETALWLDRRQNVRNARKALMSPTELSGLKRTVDMIENLADMEDETMMSQLMESLDLNVPIWYEYWFLDIYLVYGMVMVSVFILAGTFANGATILMHESGLGAQTLTPATASET